jgi:hydroxymethylpyrimidine pyrophosphatase-like HAD family hydrolase
VLYVEEIPERSQWYADRQGVKLNLVPDLAAFIDRQPSEIVAWGEAANIDRLVPRLKSGFRESLLVTKSYPTFCEIGNPESGKGNALQHLSQLLGIKQSETVAIGDGPNDISMLRWAGLGMVVGTAQPEVAAAAHRVFNNPPEECLHEAIESVLADNNSA